MASPAKATSSQIQLESAVVFQITRHLHEQFPGTAGGVLLGMEQDGVVQVTETFPLPGSAFQGDGANLQSQDLARYQDQMITKLKAVGSDSTVEGWYLSSSLGAIYEQAVLDNMYRYQKQNPDSVLIVHDVALSRATGSLSLRAFRLSQYYLDVKSQPQNQGKWTTANLLKHGLNYSDLLEELPIQIHNSQLVNLLTLSLSTEELNNNDLSQLRVPDQGLIENGIEDVLDSIDDFNYDQGNYNYYQRQLTREKQKVQQWSLKRRQENAARDAVDKPLLPTDEWKSLFKLPDEPSRLENLLVSAQLDEYCGQIEELGAISRTTLK